MHDAPRSSFAIRRQSSLAHWNRKKVRLAVIVENVKPSWLLRRAKYVATRISVLYDGR